MTLTQVVSVAAPNNVLVVQRWGFERNERGVEKTCYGAVNMLKIAMNQFDLFMDQHPLHC